MGADGKFDLRVVEPGPSSEAAGEPSSSSPGEEGPTEEGSSTEEPEVVSPEKPQQESSLTSRTVDESSEVLVEAVRVEEIPDEGIFTSDDIIDSLGECSGGIRDSYRQHGGGAECWWTEGDCRWNRRGHGRWGTASGEASIAATLEAQHLVS